ncbi:DUF2147 domain-containing protein [Piscinibacter aquaticus]|uniref:DUF2147 domain-containing protein n=1 Tax=Piscinibacter aquaticus TaxID=392597 RepID=A0A5C6U0U9_9BURK|nr:DUF2147 domain-containing protein [Piscinibacter aquaticus]
MRNKIALTLAAFFVHAAAMAQAVPVGLWKTIDDETKKEKSLVRIVDSGGVLTGRIEKVLDPTAKPDEVCDKCTDERKGKPIVGLMIIRNAGHDAEDKALWTGGDITDPNNGKTYRLRLKPLDGGKQMEVRGYFGPFFRNQTWIRVE